MALSRRAFNNILIFVSVGMLFVFQGPQMLADKRAREAGASDQALTAPVIAKPLARLEGQGWQLSLSGDQWLATPDSFDGEALAARWQQLRLVPLAAEQVTDSARALTAPEQTVLVWLAGESQPLTIRMVTVGDQLVVDAAGTLGHLPVAALGALVPGGSHMNKG